MVELCFELVKTKTVTSTLSLRKLLLFTKNLRSDESAV
jgi:hypothetical protein